MARYAQVLSTGRYVPPNRVTNQDIEVKTGAPVHDWLVANVGIEARHFMTDDQVTSDLCLYAAQDALDRAGISPSEVDLIIVATDTPDQPSPATASVLQFKLKATNAGTFDVNCACAGWVTALDVATKYIQSDTDYNRVLVVGAYGMSRYIDWDDKKTRSLFADGAGAVVLGAGDRPGILATKLLAEGSFHDALGIYGGGTAQPSTPANIEAFGAPKVEFVRRFPPTFNKDHWPPLIRQALKKGGVELEDVSLFVFTQLNLRTIETMMEELGQPIEKAHWIMDKWGYTGSACIPMCLDDAREAGRLKPGDKVVLCASGGGIAMAAAVLSWT